jgi:hypothetical protein
MFWVVAGLAAIVAVQWVRFLGRSLWVDECLTNLVIHQDALGVVSSLSNEYFQAPLYFLLAKAAVFAGGDSEIVMRLPSFLCTLGAAFLVYRLARYFFEPDVALASIVFFLTNGEARFCAINARPYGLALLLAALSLYLLVHWIVEGDMPTYIGFIVVATLCVLTQPTFISLYAMAFVFFLFRQKTVPAASSRSTGIKLLAAVTISFVLVWVLWWMRMRGVTESRQFLRTPTFDLFIFAVVRPLPIFSIAAALLFFAVQRQWPKMGAWRTTLFTLLMLLPPASLFFVSIVSEYKVFLQRYYALWSIGAALFLTCFVAALRNTWARTIVLALAVAGGFFRRNTYDTVEDWRSAAAYIHEMHLPQDATVLLGSGYIETKRTDWLVDPEWKRRLSAPFVRYPVDREIILLPYAKYQPDGKEYLDALSRDMAQRPRPIVFVCRYNNEGWINWIKKSGGGDYVPVEEKKFGSVQLVAFRKKLIRSS